MAYPPAYVRAYSFTDYETNNPGQPKPGAQLDMEYDAVANALTATQANLALIQRADGALANGSVGEDQLDPTLFAGIADDAVADAEAAAAAAAASASLAGTYATSAAASDAAAATSAATASGAAAQAGTSQSIAQNAATEAANSADIAEDAASSASASANEAQGQAIAAGMERELAFKWAELLTGPVLPAPPGWPEAVDDGMFSSKWWAIRARDYMTVTHLDLGSGQADIGQAFADWLAIPGNTMPLGLIYATWGTPPLEYALTDPSDPSNPASWTLISGGPGPPGPANTLTIGTVANSGPGGPANATITGVAPNQVLNLTLPTGATGPQGDIGPVGPPNALAIGTVTTVPDGTPAGATITGTAPTQTLNLTIPAGPPGIPGPPGPTNFANPSVLVGLAAINGASANAMRADAAPALDQGIGPNWTGQHDFTRAGVASNAAIRIMSSAPAIFFNSTTSAADSRFWEMFAGTNAFVFRSLNDATTTPAPWLQVNRSAAAISSLDFGNATNNPAYNFLGTGVVTTGGVIRGPNGSAAAPTHSFSGAPGTGMWSQAAAELDWSLAGTVIMALVPGTLYGPSFQSSSSRALKRETGAPSMVANILARLRPLLYRMLDGDDREQLGLIAEEVHEVCPQLSDGKTVAYDRLAILLLAAWQDEHVVA